MRYHLCYPARADRQGLVVCIHCKKVLSREYPQQQGREEGQVRP